MGGFANYTGDLQAKRFTLNQAKGVVTAGATFNITDKIALRGEYSFARLAADDKYSNDSRLRSRNLNFQTIIQELTLMGEYDILSLNERSFTPYVFGGLGAFYFSPYTYDAAGNEVHLVGSSTEGQGFLPGRKVYSRIQLNIPLGGGIKYAVSEDIQVGFEIGLRVLKTDYLDDVSTTYVDQNLLLQNRGQQSVDLAFRGDELKENAAPYPAGGSQRGGSNINDFYYFGQFRLSFRMPWFDNGAGGTGKSRGRRLGCPSTF
jgi:opacity protein-like surface antigen